MSRPNPIPEYIFQLAGVRPSTRLVALAIVRNGRAHYGPDGGRFVFSGSVNELSAQAVVAPRTARRALQELAQMGALGPRFGEPIALLWEPLAQPVSEAAQPHMHDALSSLPSRRDDHSGRRNADREKREKHACAVDRETQGRIADALRELGVEDWYRWTALYPVERIAEGLDRIEEMTAAGREFPNPAGMLRTLVRAPAAPRPAAETDFERRKRRYA